MFSCMSHLVKDKEKNIINQVVAQIFAKKWLMSRRLLLKVTYSWRGRCGEYIHTVCIHVLYVHCSVGEKSAAE
jgi:hypothetical protein